LRINFISETSAVFEEIRLSMSIPTWFALMSMTSLFWAESNSTANKLGMRETEPFAEDNPNHCPSRGFPRGRITNARPSPLPEDIEKEKYEEKETEDLGPKG